MLSDEYNLQKVNEVYNSYVEKYGENNILGTFIIGNANYGFAETDEDLVYVTIYLPSFEELCIGIFNNNEDNKDTNYKFYDIRNLYFHSMNNESFISNALEILFSKYYILTSRYTKAYKEYFLDNKDTIVRYNEKNRVSELVNTMIEYSKNKDNAFKIAILYHSLTLYTNAGTSSEECFRVNNPIIFQYLKAVKDGTIEIDIKDIIDKSINILNNTSEEGNFNASAIVRQGIVALMGSALQKAVPMDAFKASLTKTELNAFEAILERIKQKSGVISISKMIEETSISRPVYKSLLMKMENNKIAEVCNQGVNGTYISFY